MSPSTRRAWIEIAHHMVGDQVDDVALHPEGVDRNSSILLTFEAVPVALHPEGVDRNCSISVTLPGSSVALHPEGVDRNVCSIRIS